MVRKTVKRKTTNGSANEEADVEHSIELKKTKKQEKSNLARPLETYHAGGLASLFGKSTDGATVQEEVVKGNTVIEKPRRRRLNPNKNLNKDSQSPEVCGETPITEDKDDQADEKKTGTLDRTKQRENRILSKSYARASIENNNKTVFVGNMPLSMNEKNVRRIFSEFGTVSSVRMRNLIPANEKLSKRVTHHSKKLNSKQSSLTFYVKFEEEDSVEKALQYNGSKLDDHVVRVDKVGNKKKEFGKDMSIFVGNLPFDITEDTLIAFFSEQIGSVEAVRIIRDKTTGTGKGFAFVNFKLDSSVSLALSMETIKMDKRDLRITKVMKKGHLTRIQTAKKRTSNVNKNQSEETGKLRNFKFSTKKERTAEQNDRRALKKSAKKAIKKKKAAKKGRLMA